MNLYKISQDVNDYYDTYDSAIVCAESEEQARMTHPSANWRDWNGKVTVGFPPWCDAIDVKVELIGVAADHIKSGTVVCASYNSG